MNAGKEHVQATLDTVVTTNNTYSCASPATEYQAPLTPANF